MKIPAYKLLFHPRNFVEGAYFDTECDIHNMFLEVNTWHGESDLHITVIERPRKEITEYADDLVYRPPSVRPYLRIGSYLRIINVVKEDDAYDGFEGLYIIMDIINSTISACHDLVLRKVDSGDAYTIVMSKERNQNQTCYWVEKKKDLSAIRWNEAVELTRSSLNMTWRISKGKLPEIKKTIFNGDATVVIWEDGEKTVVHRKKGDKKSKEIGLSMAIAKRYFGSRHQFLKAIEEAEAHGE